MNFIRMVVIVGKMKKKHLFIYEAYPTNQKHVSLSKTSKNTKDFIKVVTTVTLYCENRLDILNEEENE